MQNSLKIAKQIPFAVLVKRLFKKVSPKKRINYRTSDKRLTQCNLEINKVLDVDFSVASEVKYVDRYVAHEFNFLGSNWHNFNKKDNNSVNEHHQVKTKELVEQMSSGYQLIDWQRDFRTGFTYDVTKPFFNQNPINGVDVKNCWELGRLQFLPQMAIAAIQIPENTALIAEIKNICLDFIAHNPIGMGVQWGCAMDVGIRISNILVAVDILHHKLDEKFKQVIADTAFQHAQFIYNNIEYKEGAGGNHYLFNLVGLLFVSKYLSNSSEVKLWRAYAVEEIQNEIEKQFFNDGGNFEGSTTYHSLSAEAIIYGVALLMGESCEIERGRLIKLFNSGVFIKKIMKQDGTIPQFGDNDSGRLFKLGNEDKNLLNYESLLAAFAGLFENEFDEFALKYPFSKNIVANFASGRSVELKAQELSFGQNIKIDYAYKDHQQTVLPFNKEIAPSQLEKIVFPEFGVYGFKSSEFYLLVSAIANPKMHHSWGHVHNDKSSFELNVYGEDLVSDPGSYCYGTNLALRNEFRSTRAHHGILINGKEQGKMFHPFYLEPAIKCDLVEMTENSLVLKSSYYGAKHVRKFLILPDKLIIDDYCNLPFEVNINKFDKYAANYGVK